MVKKLTVLCMLAFFPFSAWAGQANQALTLTGDCPRCDLSKKKMNNINLSGADLSRAILRKAKLKGADLSFCNLTGADLRGANLSHANISSADLFGANLTGAKIKGADFTGARLAGAIWVDGLPCSINAALGLCH